MAEWTVFHDLLFICLVQTITRVKLSISCLKVPSEIMAFRIVSEVTRAVKISRYIIIDI